MKQIKAESIISVLIAVGLLSIILLVYSYWQSKQHKQANFLYQQQQALQIAENQIALKLANMECKRSVLQNNLQFLIECQAQHIKVKFPLGEIKIENP